MPAFVLIPATPSDLEAITRVQFAACADDPGFQTIFPGGQTLASVSQMVRTQEDEMDEDPSVHMMIVKEAMYGEIAAFATWHFYPPRSSEEIDHEMLAADFPFPSDANAELGNRLMHNSVRKRHEVVQSVIGPERPHIFLANVGTHPKYQRQGAASKLLEWGVERADDRGLSIYVEATPAAVRLYEKHGFRKVDSLKLELSPFKEGNFENFCMVRDPRSA